ncbi:MAG: hypothetical protein QMD22_06550 [archaeon]|nr:hypothetical protein [archaeon]
MPRIQLEKKTERLHKQFFTHLTMNKGISAETASEHAQRVDFFALHYLGDYIGKRVLDASGGDREDHLGDWYIRKVLNSTKGDVRPILVAFKKFFKFLYERGEIDKEQLDDILSACKNPQRYIRRFETYFELDPASVAWDAEFEEWLMGYGEEIEEDYEQPYEVNEEINRTFSERGSCRHLSCSGFSASALRKIETNISSGMVWE